MLMFIVILILLMFLFLKLTDKYVNPYKLIMIFGKKGSGKTTTLTKIALREMRKKKKVYSTVEIPSTYLFSCDEIGQMTFEPNSVVLIDEVGMIWDNRDFKNFKPAVRDFFKYQRQYKLKIYLFSQTFDIDLKLRNLTDEMYLLSNCLRVFSVARRISKKITIKECADGTSTLSDTYEFYPFFLGGLKFTFIPRYTCFYKSYDPKRLAFISGEYLELNDLQQRYLSTRKWLFDKFKICFVKLVEKLKRSVRSHSRTGAPKKKRGIEGHA